MYYVLLHGLEERQALIASLKRADIQGVFHYVPLHSAPAGRLHGRADGELAVTDRVSERLLRLPLWLGLEEHQEHIVQVIAEALG
jgi:dTDP-4-amino-4,6-dideoxygalactose transaminase